MPLRPGAVTQGKIDRTRSFWDKLIERPLEGTHTYNEEGTVMVEVAEAGISHRVLDASAGAANERFVGCAISDYMRLTSFVHVEQTVIPSVAAFTFQLEKTVPTAGTFYVEDNTILGTAWTDASPGAPAATTQYAVSAGGLVTFHASDAGKTVNIRYTYTPSTTEMTSRFHDRPYAAQGQSLLGQTAIAVGNCELYTTMYETSDTWTIGIRVYSGRNGGTRGVFTTDNTAVAVSGRVISIPSTTDVFLGVAYNIGTFYTW